ncbi:MAG: DUF2207 domain-containing protein [Synergistaceae bacterium]|nr:DUF2207 domain-containing protein [Synergistaceae bacterium]
MRIRRDVLFIKTALLCAAVFVILSAAQFAEAMETFNRFHADLVINENSSVEVTEEILVNVENIEINRGIIRSLPVEYRDGEGNSIELGLEIIDIKLDGQDVSWSSVRSGINVNVKIGDANKIIPKGLHTFLIRYQVERHIGFFDDHDELYWNVTGKDFSFPVLEASCRVALPGKSFGEGFNTIEWYVGQQGTKGDNSRARLDSGSVQTTGTLQPGEVLTVVYTWPKGLVTPPPPPAKDNEKAQGGIAAATFALISGWFWFAWRKWGKDPDKKTVIPLFYAPDGASPAFLRYVRDMRLDQTGFTAAIIGLAVKGAIKIQEVEGKGTFFGKGKGHFVLYEKDTEPEKLQPEEEALMMQLFPGSIDSVALLQDNSGIISSAMRSLARNLRKANSAIFTRNTDKMIPGLALYGLGAAASYPFSGEYPLNTLMAAVCGLLIIALGMRLSKAANTGGQNIKQFLVRAFPAIAVALVGSIAIAGEGMSPFTFALFVASAGVIAVMRPLMVSRTTKGSNILSDSEGLKLYMDTAEKERLEMFNPPEETPELFEKLLPYALALDVAKTWGNRFESVLTKASYKPEWYSGPSPYLFLSGAGLNDFSSNLGSSLGQSMAPQSAPGSSSGMGGGGFAGGGGGGGGASGW